MRVLFVFPNLNAEEGFNHGIAALSGALREQGHETSLLNLNEALDRVPDPTEIATLIAAERPDCVGFSTMSQQYPFALKVARQLKKRCPELPIAVGGVHTIMCTDEVLADDIWDFVGVGECDETFPQLVSLLEAKDPAVETVAGFCIRKPRGGYRRNPLPRYPDLALLPPKDYEIFDLPQMLESKNYWQSVLTSRGCPYRCTYCFNHEVTDRYRADGHARKSFLRHYPIDRIIGELTRLLEKYPIETFIFDDDLFTLNRDYCIEFVRAYVDAGITVPFVLNAHVQTFSRPIAEALADSPCMIVKFGVESGSFELRRKVLERYMTNEQIIEAFDLCHEFNLHTSAFLMFGLPYETRSQMEETIDLLARIQPGRMRWSIFYPFPGTKSYEICAAGDLIRPDRMKHLTNFFGASCLKQDPEVDLFVEKLQKTFHWWVNAGSDFQLAGEYQKLVADIDSLSSTEWAEAAPGILERDREISDRHLRSGGAAARHYSIRYTEVMAVDSRYVEREPGPYKNRPARRWRAYEPSRNRDGADPPAGGLEWRSIPVPERPRSLVDAPSE